jgi:hypothetical protein
MHEHAALLARLTQIAAQSSPCDERRERALALLNASSARLYARLGIGAANRLTASAKSSADQMLADLRRRILAAELRAPASSRSIFTALRHRIDMMRRVLASRSIKESKSGPISSGPAQRLYPIFAAPVPSLSQDWHIIAQLRRGLDDRERIARSRAAIEESLSLLGLDSSARALGPAPSRGHRFLARARLGNLSGQLTM